MHKKILIYLDKKYRIIIKKTFKKSEDMSFNALKINPKRGVIEEINLSDFKETNIEKNIKRFSLLPLILEKIVIDYENELTMLTEIKKSSNIKKDTRKGFYFKGYFISSSAVIIKSSFSSIYPFIEYSSIENIEDSKRFLDNKVVFPKEKDLILQKKLQIEIIENICKCGTNPFDIMTFYDKKYSMKTLKIIDIIDALVAKDSEFSLEVLKNVSKTLKAICETNINNTANEKNSFCLNILQQMCNSIEFN